MGSDQGAGQTRWIVHGERVLDDTRRASISVATVELPDGTVFEQYVVRMPRAAMVVMLDDAGEHVLMMWRHRWIVDRWVWELPGGYIDTGESPESAAAREVEEETGWRPRVPLRQVAAFQPMIGCTDSEQLVFLTQGADRIGPPEDINEAESIAWLPLDDVLDRIRAGEIIGSATIIGLQAAILARRPR